MRTPRRSFAAWALVAGLAALAVTGLWPRDALTPAAAVTSPPEGTVASQAPAHPAPPRSQAAPPARTGVPAVDRPTRPAVPLTPAFASIRVPIAEYLDTVEASGDARRAGYVFAAGVACLSASTSDTGHLPEGLRFLFRLDEPVSDAWLAEVASAKAAVAAWCAGQDIDALAERGRRLAKADGWVGRGLTSLVPRDLPFHEKQRQEIVQILLNPQIHALEFDRWTAFLMERQVPMVGALSRAQRHLVREQLAQDVAGLAPDPMSLRSLYTCLGHFWCPSSADQVPAAQREQARQVADQVARQIREQRLDELLTWPR